METSNVKRRLTSILAADAVGFSRQTSVDEEGTLRVLAAHRAVIDGIIAFHEGRIVGTAGDSVLAEFGSPVEAVRCAVEIQEALKTRNDSLPEDKRLLFRVGVNLGDVVVKNDDILGDGVNVASRLESIAEPGGVCISSSVYDQITGKLNLGFQDIGEQNLKNISRPIRAYRIAGTGAPQRPAAAASAKRAIGPWIAGAIVLVAGMGFAAWKAGWLGSGAVHEGGAPAIAPAPVQSEPGKVKVAADEAAATRTKAEEEIARTRADAEAMKRAAEVELARARADADAGRSARMKAEAEAAASRTKEEANALKRAAEAEMAKAQQARKEAETEAEKAITALARSESEAEAEKAKAAQTRKAASASGAKGAPVAVNAYDGLWTVRRSCDEYQDVAAFSDEFVARISAGAVEMERGTPGQPGHMIVRGVVADDGALTLTGTVISRNKRNYGRETKAVLTGSLRGETPVLTGGWGGRHCTFKFARTN